MTSLQAIVAASVSLAAGLWLLLPRGGSPGRGIGAFLSAAALALFAYLVVRIDPEHKIGDAVFLLLAATTIVSAIGAVTLRSPVYCAIWFALTLLGTAGLFLYQGAQFLGVATVVVYAGAILVTFLFVLMLAQPKGLTSYDRVSWEGMLSAATGAVLVGLLSAIVFAPPPVERGPSGSLAGAAAGRVSTADREADILSPQHMAHLGGQLFSRYLIAVEVAGTLLLVALVGAVGIVAQGKAAGIAQVGRTSSPSAGRSSAAWNAGDGPEVRPTEQGGRSHG
ncbi:MAG TPA: NADH-quinone oxidoreductase subunit J [Pirellulales bacterium]|nr:NADH-quinone oxidoreductase subunit J [Pirellulales bacterium]